MDDQLLGYYERELTFIREMGAEFAGKYPKIAGRLQLEAEKCDDPHTERLIEAFAFISGRIHKKVDDDFPELSESLLNIIYPHYVRPIPSMSVIQFEPVKQNIPPSGYLIENKTPLYSKPVKGVPCRFTTCQPVTIWPVEVVSAKLHDPIKQVKNARQVISIQLKTFNNLNFSELKWNNLRFFLNGQYQHIFRLYELLFNNVCHIECQGQTKKGNIETISLKPGDICSVGFAPDQGMLPYSKRSFPGYLLLSEYFCFPEKFLFFDLQGIDKIKPYALGDTLDIRIYLDTKVSSAKLQVDKETFCINCTPAVNLFKRIAEPIRVEQRKTEYQVIPDVRRQDSTEVFSLDQVTSSSPDGTSEIVEFKPFYSVKHHLNPVDERKQEAFWHIQRRLSGRKGDNGTEVFLSFADLDFKPADPGIEILTIHATCTNRDIPGRLPFGDPNGDFDMELAAPVTRINSVVKPTPTRRPFLGGALQWRLISHLSLNYMSLVSGGEDALKEILYLYNFDNSPATRHQINGIVSLNSRHITKRIGQAFSRGIEVTITFDEDKFVGAGLYLFASIIERFLGQYVSVNSFSQLVVKTAQREGILKRWPPRSGNQILL